jgi:hypothetical protein
VPFAQLDQAIKDRFPFLVAGKIVIGDEEFVDALCPVETRRIHISEHVRCSRAVTPGSDSRRNGEWVLDRTRSTAPARKLRDHETRPIRTCAGID